MESIKCIFSYTFLKQIKSSAFKIVTVLIGIVIIFTFIMTKVMNNSEDKVIINVLDEVGSFSEISELNDVLEHSEINMINKNMSDTECRKMVNDVDNNIIIKLSQNEEEGLNIKVYDNYRVDEIDLKIIENYVNSIIKCDLLDRINISDKEKMALMNDVYCEIVQVDTSFETSYLIGYILLILLVLSIMMYGSQVAGEITYTKTNRVMELLLTSASPKAIFIGTTAAVGAAGLLQLAIIIVTGVLSYVVIKPEIVIIDGLQLDFSIITYDKIIVYIMFFILSYLFFAVLNAGIGSLVSKNEDVMVAVLPVTLISCVQLFTGLLVLADSNSALAKFFSYFPLTSAGTMVMRYFIGSATTFNVFISLIILIITLIILTNISIKIFVNGVLYYGNLSLKSILNLRGNS